MEIITIYVISCIILLIQIGSEATIKNHSTASSIVGLTQLTLLCVQLMILFYALYAGKVVW